MIFLENSTALDIDFICDKFPYVSDVKDLLSGLDCTIIVEGERLKLQSPYSNPVFTNIESQLDYHKKFFFKNSIYKEPLAKAIGLKKGQIKPIIYDATAGMLGDSILIYSFGFKVHAFERNPIAYILSKNALSLAESIFNLEFGLASTKIESSDVIYFDPMYEEKNDKTLPKKEMRIFREVVGVDSDAKIEAEKLKLLTKRLVIKRSTKANSLIENPSFSIKGKSTRYDIYLNS